ncbi:hypothetical protein GCM10009425_18200 [Pseudomonas asuensis]|uniref:Uncharacterized protein n=1 Tax=Pseudomonas asuensis TaxID=1825787 RepID=A0ABQ2GPU3_9PSED|nr:hypothetical protein GCM10009425_18200 [Pseudomonas asuensis]
MALLVFFLASTRAGIVAADLFQRVADRGCWTMIAMRSMNMMMVMIVVVIAIRAMDMGLLVHRLLR